MGHVAVTVPCARLLRIVDSIMDMIFQSSRELVFPIMYCCSTLPREIKEKL